MSRAKKDTPPRFPKFRDAFLELMGDMTLDQFSKKLEMSRATVGFYAAGQRIPDALGLKKIAEKCNVSADWLIGLSEEKEINGVMSQVCKYVGINKDSVLLLKDLCQSQAKKTVIEFLLSHREFWEDLIEYISASAWDNVKEDKLGMCPPTKKEVEEYKRKQEEFPNRLLLGPIPSPIFKPSSDLSERIEFAETIKNLSKLYDEFKAQHATCDSFLTSVVADYVASYIQAAEE